jgi:hypothetical protein
MCRRVSEWFIGLGYGGKLAIWLMASFLLYTLASQLAWQSQWIVPGRDSRLGRLIDRMHGQSLTPWMREAIRLVYYLGIPFTEAINGLLAADLLGLSGTDWAQGQGVQGFLWEDWARGLGLTVTAVLATRAVWFAAHLFSRRAGLSPVTSGVPGRAWQRLLDVFYQQIHWAFYRSGPILWLGDLYWGTFAGFLLVLLEAMLNPALRWALKSPQTAGSLLTRLSMAGMSTLLFLATQNLWLTTAAHLVLVGLLGKSEPEGRLYADGSA